MTLRKQMTNISSLSVLDNTGGEELFAEKFNKVTFRNFKGTTRLQIKGVDLQQKKANRDRAINYWQNNVVQNFLPPIDKKKKEEVDERVN